MPETRSTCPYCGVGCGVIITSDGQQITAVRGDPAHPANQGKLCTKGSSLHLTAAPALAQQSRLLQPMQRLQRGAAPEARSWDTALDQLARQLLQIHDEHGPDALGFYLSGQLLTEDYYVFNKLVKGLLGTNNLDTNSRLCMSSAVAGYKATLGADAPPACYEDIDLAGCLFISGSNMAWAHPILFRRVEEAKARHPERKIIVVDPRRTETAELADLHLALQPGTDVMLCHGLLHIMLAQGWADPAFIDAHTSGFAQLHAIVREATPERVAQVCGLALADLYLAAQWLAWGGADAPGTNSERLPTLSLYCQGLNQSSSGTANNAALINLHLATGQIGKPGAGPLSLTGQPNAMGGREVG
ncbi:MAG: molybdopterin-dependent oxidoreductase, partial [Comamonas sp.]|nr:molybdopterin-dependent oxidoreductase [Comamonas sp.]